MVVRVVLVAALSMAVLGSASLAAVAQEARSPTQEMVLARFDDARALAVDPRGRLYVAEAARDVVEILGPRGQRRTVLGGSGMQAGAFDTPADIDPTNGQVLLVADTYNGRVQRFSEDGQYLESLPIGRLDREGGAEWRVPDGADGRAVRADGRPVAVVRDDEGSIFVLDQRTRRLLTWSDMGRGGQLTATGANRLQEPVALAVGGGRLYVADTGRGVVWVFDTFGTVVQRLSLPPVPTVRALSMHQGRLWIVCANRVLVWTRGEGLVAEHSTGLSEPLVDAASDGRYTYLLTETRLLRRPGW